MRVYIQYETVDKKIQGGFIEEVSTEAAKRWFIQHRPKGSRLRVLKPIFSTFQITAGSSTKNLEDLRKKFIQEQKEEIL